MSTLTDFVSAEESVLVRWEGTLRDGNGDTDVVVGTTERCIVFCSETGQFGLFPREHVSSVESEAGTVVEYDLEDYRLFVAGGGALAAAGFLGGILASSGVLSLVLLLVACAGLWFGEHGWRHREEYAGAERVPVEIERVVVRTAGGARTEFLFPAEARAGAELARFVRSE